MMGIFALIFWICIGGILHSYLLYPLLLRWWAAEKKSKSPAPILPDPAPYISVLLSAYNEEAVLETKLQNLLELDYPADRLRFFVGSDGSSDQTNAILQRFAARPEFSIFRFDQRRGKPSVLNDLAAAAQEAYSDSDHLFLLTDASVLIDPRTPQLLVRHFQDPAIGLVDTRMVHTGLAASGISKPEDRYISREVQVKAYESRLWGTMIGPFGGCFAMRAALYEPIPPNYLVDDFYLAMQVFLKGGKAINDLEALAYEPVSHDLKEEFRRKARISAGNFQNMAHFRKLWWPPLQPLSFAFFSHKVLRWISPFLMLISGLMSASLALSGNQFYIGVFLFQVAVVVLPLLVDLLLRSVNIHWITLRALRYFWMMNLALLKGFFRYWRGIQKGTWEPPKRTLS